MEMNKGGYREWLAKTAASNGWNYNQPQPRMQPGAAPGQPAAPNNTFTYTPGMSYLQPMQPMSPQQTAAMKRRMQFEADKAKAAEEGSWWNQLKGGAATFFKELPYSTANAGRGIIRGAANFIPGAVSTVMNIPYALQRAGEIMTGKYSDYDGIVNKWRASREGGENGAAKFFAGAANDFMDNLNRWEDNIGLDYDPDYPGWARSASESVGAYLGGMGLGKLSEMSRVMGGKKPVLTPKAAPGTPAAAAPAQPPPRSMGAWGYADQAKDLYKKVPTSVKGVTQKAVHAGINKFVSPQYQQTANNLVDLGYGAWDYISPAVPKPWGATVGSMPMPQTVNNPQQNNMEVPQSTYNNLPAPALTPYEQYANNWNSTYGNEYGY